MKPIFLLPRLLVGAVCVAAISGLMRPALAQDTPIPSDDEVLIHFHGNLSVQKFVEDVAKITRQIYMYNPADVANKTVFLHLEGVRLPRQAMFNMLQAILSQVSLTVTDYGEIANDNVKIYRIQKVEDAGRQMGRLNLGSIDDLKETANFVTMVVHLKYAEPNSVQRALLNLVSRPGGSVQPIMGVNAVLISDYEYQIKRMATLLRMLDQPGPQVEMAVLPVQFAEASQIATTVGNLVRARMQAQRVQGVPNTQDQQILLEADARTNSIIVQALPDSIKLIRQLVRKLDVEIPNEVKGRIHIYFCKHADAEELQTILDNLINGNAFRQEDPANRTSTQGGGTVTGPDGTVIPTPAPNSGANASATRRSQFRGTNTTTQEYKPAVVADKATNSLIITATAEDYLEMRRVLNELDRRKPQVMIEAAILEVNAEQNLEFGVELGTVDNPKQGEYRFFGSTLFGLSDIVDESGVPVGDTGIPAGRSPRFSDGVVLALNKNNFFGIPILLKATQAVTNANVLSQPRILTNDNEEAQLKFIRQEPTISSTTTRTTTDRTAFNGYEDAGITFKITPHISSEQGLGEYLRLKIDLSVESFANRSPNTPAEAPPPKNTRTITGEVTIPNNSTIIIGGLTATEATKIVKKIPIVSDIPVLGELFKFEQTLERRTNLYIFIRPVILRDEDFGDLRGMSQKSINEAELNVKDTMTKSHQEFFDQSRKDEESFKADDEGRYRHRSRFLGVYADHEKREEDYRNAAEKRALTREAEEASKRGSAGDHSVRVTTTK